MWWKIFVMGLIWWAAGWAWGSDRILLRDLSVITLHQGQMTTGRRSSPVPQIKCVGGTAGCRGFVPNTVQCRNVGHDGYDVQWECKADMDDSYRFGKIQVTCEGYDYPDDPYILKGSCGLEYTIDTTEAGKSRNQNYGGGYNSYSPSWNSNEESSGSWFLFFVIVFGVVFLICKMSSSTNEDSNTTRHPNRGDHSGYPPNSGNNPPPYGFKPEYTRSDSNYVPPPTYSDATNTRSSSTTTNTSPIGGFWSGLGLGSLGGYIFGNRHNRSYYHSSPGWGGGWGNNNRGWGNSWGSGSGWGNSCGNRGGWGSSWGSSSTSYRGSSGRSTSGTTRTASGFGGTSRR